jgi:hypothetical protein
VGTSLALRQQELSHQAGRARRGREVEVEVDSDLRQERRRNLLSARHLDAPLGTGLVGFLPSKHAITPEHWLTGSTALTLLAWLIVFNEARINDHLITWT